ncbi:hypothetical protein NL676_034673 [Syzygium grande]|nr:hypothetical protein NL676_034673 [Syzygium grande]
MILLRNYLGGGESPTAAPGELREAVEKAKMTPAEMSEVLLNQNRWNKERAVGELLEVLKTRAERNEKYGGGPTEERELNEVAVQEEEMVIFAS